MDEMDTVTSCYLCSKSIVLKGGDKTNFTDHISIVHGVTINHSFLAAWNFLDLNVRSNLESLVMSITVNSRDSQQYEGSSGEDRLVIDEDELDEDDKLDENWHYETDDCESPQDVNLKRKRQEANIKQSTNNSNKRIMKEINVIKEVDDEEDVGIKIEECDVEVEMEYEESPVRNPIKIKTPAKLNEEKSIRNPIKIKTPAKLNEESSIRNPIKNKTPVKKLEKVTASDIQVSVS